MEDLPKELIISILSFVEPNFIMRTCWLTCKSLRATILVDPNNCKVLWKAWLRQHTPQVLHELPRPSAVASLPNATLALLICQYVPTGWTESYTTRGYGYNGQTGTTVLQKIGEMNVMYVWGDPHGVAAENVTLKIPLKARLNAICALNFRQTLLSALNLRSNDACDASLGLRGNDIRDLAVDLQRYNVSHSFSDVYEENWQDPPIVDEWTVENSKEDEVYAELKHSMQKTDS